MTRLEDIFLVRESVDVPPGIKREMNARLFHLMMWNGYMHPEETVRFDPRIPQSASGKGIFQKTGILTTKVGERDFSEKEDTSTPRISFSPTLKGCIEALVIKDLKKTSQTYAVYRPKRAIEVVVPSSHPLPEFEGSPDPSKWFVWDVQKTGEVWSLSPVELEYVGIIPRRTKVPNTPTEEDALLSKMSKDLPAYTKSHPNYAYFNPDKVKK